MLFNSTTFLFAFLPVTWAVFWLLGSHRSRLAWLAATGYVFYAAWDWRFCGLMLLSTLVSYSVGRALGTVRSAGLRRLLASAAIGLELTLLAVFKYADFALDSLASLAGLLGHPAAPEPLGIILPVGLSFYTIHTITYVVDAYNRRIEPTADLFEYATYVSLFAQLVAGPIVRFGQVEKDLKSVGSVSWRDRVDPACTLFALGLVKKVLLADSLATLVNPLLAGSGPGGAVAAWLALLGYTYQLYFDFSGYSDMALGLGELFGIRLPRNFDAPYRATDPADFWRRWHITLSNVLRDYVFYPMGGALGSTARGCRNLVLTMLVGGLWHGANWTFVIWGGYHGVLLAAQLALWGGRRKPLPGGRVVTFLLVSLGWVLFRSGSLEFATGWYRALISPAAGELPLQTLPLLVAVAVAAAFAHVGPTSLQVYEKTSSRGLLLLAGAFVLAVLVVVSGAVSPFLYFQF